MKNICNKSLFIICISLPLFIVSSCAEPSQQSVSVEDTIGTSPEYKNYESSFADLTTFLMNSDFEASKLHDIMLKDGYVSFEDIPDDKLRGILDVSEYFILQKAQDDALDELNHKYGYLKLDKEVRLEIQRVYGVTSTLPTTLD